MIVALQGGLANQMFQYAFGISTAKARGEEVRFNRTRVDADFKRSYSLDALAVDLEFEHHEQSPYYWDPGFFDARVYTQPANTTYVGFWQTEKYFDEPLVRASLVPKQISSISRAVANSLTGKSTFIHVRRGDYVTDPSTMRFHGSLGMDYYSRAVRYIQERVEDAKFVVFSNEPDWCRSVFPRDFLIVDHNKPGDGKQTGQEHEDLWIMSQCQHAIIANSAFSWWGAWLGDHHAERIVVAPEKWFQEPTACYRDIVPERWVKL